MSDEDLKRDQGGWGHQPRRTDINGERRWGARIGNVSITIGETFLVPYGEPAKVLNVGTEEHPILNFYIPQGKAGADYEAKGFSARTPMMVVEKGQVTYINTQMQGVLNVVTGSDIGTLTGKLENGLLTAQLTLEETVKELISLGVDRAMLAVENLRKEMVGDSPVLFRIQQVEERYPKLLEQIADLSIRVKKLEKGIAAS
jgi:hypothetical protein